MGLSRRQKLAAWGAAVLGLGLVLAASRDSQAQRGPLGPPRPGPADPGQVTTPLATTDAYTVRDPKRAWASEYTASNLDAALRKYDNAAHVLDVSREGGGEFPPHKSHQEGRDVDVRIPPTRGELHALLEILLAQLDAEGEPAVTAIFLDDEIQRDLFEAFPDTDVGRALDHPKRRRETRARVWHWPGHVNHLHVRFRR